MAYIKNIAAPADTTTENSVGIAIEAALLSALIWWSSVVGSYGAGAVLLMLPSQQ